MVDDDQAGVCRVQARRLPLTPDPEEQVDLATVLNDTKTGFDTTNEAGQRLEGMFDGLSEKTWGALDAAKETAKSQEEFDRIYRTYFTGQETLPARTRMQAGRTPMDCALEVEAIGYVPRGS